MDVIRRAAIASAVALLLVLVAGRPAGAASSLAVTPSAELHDGDTVTISGTGFNPDSTIGICQGIEGRGTPVNLCGSGLTAIEYPDSTGTFTSEFSVKRLMTVLGLLKTFDCLVDHCVIYASEIPDLTNATSAPITFSDDPPPPEPGDLVTTLTGYREVDASDQRGSGDLDGYGGARLTTISFNSICYSLFVRGIAVPAVGAHIHEGVWGTNGPIVADLTPPGSNGMSAGCIDVGSELVDRIVDDPAGFYVNIHTGQFPDGAIRGNLRGVYDEISGSATRLTGAAEIGPDGRPAAGDADGFGVATVSITEGRVCFGLGVRQIDLPALAAHIHRGRAGVNGPIVVTLVPPGASGTRGGCVDGTAPDLREEIRLHPGRFYVNVHTAGFADGALRGNLRNVIT